MDDPDFTDAHLEQLRRVDDGRELARAQGFAPRGGPALPRLLNDIVVLGLVAWDGGAGVRDRATLAELAPLERLRVPQHRVTAAGRIVLGLKSLDGTAAPPEHCNPRPESTTVGDQD